MGENFTNEDKAPGEWCQNKNVRRKKSQNEKEKQNKQRQQYPYILMCVDMSIEEANSYE